jgi:acetyl/propionyl-CoA carboxylase alpha subunit
VQTGSEISPFYDPLVAKVLVHADARTEAVKSMRMALGGYNRYTALKPM